MRRLATLVVVSLLVAACGSSTASGSPVASGAESAPASPAASGAPASSAASGAVDTSAAPTAATASDGQGPGSSAAVDFPSVPPASGAADATPAVSQSAACATINGAIGIVDLYTQLLSQVDASNWADLTGPGSPVSFSLAKLDKAIATLSAYPGAKDLGANLNEVRTVVAIALKDPAPFSPQSSAGKAVTDTVQRLFVPIGVAMTQLREKKGCPVQ